MTHEALNSSTPTEVELESQGPFRPNNEGRALLLFFLLLGVIALMLLIFSAGEFGTSAHSLAERPLH